MVARLAARHHHGLLRANLCFSRYTSASPPTSRIPQSRCEHSVPVIRNPKHNDTILQNGISDLHSPASVSEAWTKYMTHILSRLNHILAGDPRVSMPLKDLSIEVARNPSTANTFNYASMAHNTHFYYQSLSPFPDPVAIPSGLSAPLTRSFSSIDTFRQTFLSTAAAMFGPGFVWLVALRNPSPNHPNTDSVAVRADEYSRVLSRRPPSTALGAAQNWDFRILTTYIAGSPYPGAHARQQSRDLNTQNVGSVREEGVGNTVGSFGPHAGGRQEGVARWGGADVVPVLCVSTWEHVYMMDWGVDGKRGFLERWWDRIDWEEVWKRAHVDMGIEGGARSDAWSWSGSRGKR